MHEYSYQFEHDEMSVLVKIVRRFECVTEVEDLAHFPHQMRRQWAIYLIRKLTLTGTATLSSDDVNCLFAKHVIELFDSPVTVTCGKEANQLVLYLQVLFLHKTRLFTLD